jgi:hypothetical protein
MASTINVKDFISDPKLLENATFSRIMSPEERKSKLKREERDAFVANLKEIVLSIFALVMTGIFVYICLAIINNPDSSADDKKWATSLITLMASGVIGYLTGKGSK